MFRILDGKQEGASDANAPSFSIVHKIKLEASKIFHLIWGYRLNKRITSLLRLFKYQLENQDHYFDQRIIHPGSRQVQKNHIHADKINETFLLSEDLQEKLAQVFKDYSEEEGKKINVILLDLMLCNNQALRSSALQLMFRNSSQKEELEESLRSLEILVSDEMAASYDEMSRSISLLRSLVNMRMRVEAEQESLKILDRIIAGNIYF